LAKSFKYQGTEGVLVGDVQADSPAEHAGLKSGDIIVKLNDEKIRNANQLRNGIAAIKPGAQAALEINRQGAEKSLMVKVGTLKAEQLASTTNSETSTTLSMAVENLTPEAAQALGDENLQGVLVTEVDPGGLAAQAGLQPKDVIASVQGKPVRNTRQFHAEINRHSLKDGVRLTVQTDGVKRFVFLQETEEK
jgi:serine protease Do